VRSKHRRPPTGLDSFLQLLMWHLDREGQRGKSLWHWYHSKRKDQRTEVPASWLLHDGRRISVYHSPRTFGHRYVFLGFVIRRDKLSGRDPVNDLPKFPSARMRMALQLVPLHLNLTVTHYIFTRQRLCVDDSVGLDTRAAVSIAIE
jgi:hypothetical protein